MFRHPLILSAFLLFFLPAIAFSQTSNKNDIPDNRMNALISELKVLSTDLAEWNTASQVFIARLDSIIARYETRTCPPDFEGLLGELDAFVSEIAVAQQKAAELKRRRAVVVSALESAEKQHDGAKANLLKSKLATIDAGIFKIESKGAIIHPDWFKAFRKIFMKYMVDTCPGDMVFIEGIFCIDKYEYPNRKDAVPAMNISYPEAAAACRAEGKRLCTQLEWARACLGPKCLYNHEALKDISPSDCNAGLDIFRSRAPYPSGDRPECDTSEGVSEIYGNVWEWTSGEYHNRYRVVRGGAASRDRMLSCGNSTWAEPTAREPYFGFRCCADPAPPPPEPAAPAPSATPATGTTTVPAE